MRGDCQVKPKILFFDAETSPVPAWVFRFGKQWVGHDQMMEGYKSDIICVCWKWNYENQIHSADWGFYRQCSDKLVAKFVKEAEKADLVIAHNATKFDIKHVNTQRLLHGQNPIAWPEIEDTLTQIRKHFYFPSYRLDYISKILAGEGKDIMVQDDWIAIVTRKHPKFLRKMIKYCEKDVLLLEKVFNKVSKFCTPKTNMALVTEAGRYGCPRCGSDKVIHHGVRRTLARMYQRLCCKVCGSVFKGASL